MKQKTQSEVFEKCNDALHKLATGKKSEVTVNESKHTPGTYYTHGTNVKCRDNEGNILTIANCSVSSFIEQPQAEANAQRIVTAVNSYDRHTDANARLIAAAPDMLEALKEIKFKTECGNLTTMAMGTIGDICVKAIAKATNSK